MEDKKSNQLTWSPNEAAAAMGISDARFRIIEWVNELGRKRYGLPERPASKTFDLIMGKRREKEA